MLKEYKNLGNLFSYYSNLVVKNGYTETISWPYTYNYYKNGKKINWSSRTLYRIKGKSLKINDPFDLNSYSMLYKFQSLLIWIRKALLFSVKVIYRKAKLL